MPAKRAISLIAVFAWGCATVWAFWIFEARYLRPVGRPAGAAQLEPSSRPPSPVTLLSTSSGSIFLDHPSQITLLNFWNSTCPCSRFMEPHVRALTEQYASKGVRFVTIIECDPDKASIADAREKWLSRGFSPSAMPYVIDAGDALARRFGVWAAPAAVILDARGHVEYVGAYNVARFCDHSETAYASVALASIIAGRRPIHPSMPFYGCQVTPGMAQVVDAGTAPLRGTRL